MSTRILTGDCREIMPSEGPFDMIIADPPYKQTSLPWDRRRVVGWEAIAHSRLKPTGSLWVFGSMHFIAEGWMALIKTGFQFAQDVVWEKQNGTNRANDRFRRIHEHIVQFYKTEAAWADVWNDVQTTKDATARTVRKKKRPAQWMGATGETIYRSEDGGPRIMRSVIEIPNCHGHAIHETEKPVDLLQILIRTSCPPGGLVGDFFAGSGAAAEACDVAGRHYVGCEIDAEMAERARNRSLFVAA